MKIISIFILIFFYGLGFTQENSPTEVPFEDALLEMLYGSWKLSGVVLEDSVEYQMDGYWTLNHHFFLMHMQDIKRPSSYEAFVFIGYHSEKNCYIVHWLDQFGGKYSETLGYGTASENSINLLFKYPDSHFRDTFTYIKERDEWHFLLESKDQKNQWQKFAEYMVTRK